MQLPFLEALEREQKLALIAAIVRRMGELDLLSLAAADREPLAVAHEIVGSTDVKTMEKWAVVNAAIALGCQGLGCRCRRRRGVASADLDQLGGEYRTRRKSPESSP